MREAIVASKYLGGLIKEGRRRHGWDLESHVVHDEGVKRAMGAAVEGSWVYGRGFDLGAAARW